MTRSYVLGAVLGSLWLAGCSFGVDGNGQRVEESRDVAAFSRVNNDSELDLELVQSDVQSVTVSIDSNLQHLVTTRVANDTLYVDLRENVDQVVAGPHVRIAVPVLTGAKLAGSGRMTLAFDEPSSPLDVHLSGSGDLRFEGKAAGVGAFLSGSGEIELAGEASDVELSLSGSGDIRARSLTAESGELDLSGSGSISADVLDSVRVSLSGSGRIDLFGGASVDAYKNTGSGELAQH